MNRPLQRPLEWLIVGGGPIGVHVAVRLLAEGGVSPDQLRVVDPHPALLHRWRSCVASTGMRYLRSPAVHHLGVQPFELLQLGGAKKRDRRRSRHFAPPYNRPSVALFAKHCRQVVEDHGLDALHIQDRVEALGLGPGVARARLGSGRVVRSERVVLALGNSDRPRWPEVACALREQGGQVLHVFSESAPVDPSTLPEVVAIVGGGISAAQLAARLAAAGKTVHVLARHEPRVHQFDSDPGWIGPRFMRGFVATRDYARRREMIQEARHAGSMPPDVHRDLHAAMHSGAVHWRVCTLMGGTVDDNGALQLVLDDDGPDLSAGAMVLATGFVAGRPGGKLLDRLIADHDLAVAPCGFPVVDTALRWHPRLFVTGPLAELELGPTARNLTGGRRAAERLLEVARGPGRRRSVMARFTRA